MKPKARGNGQGTAYKRGRTWEAQVVIGWVKNKKDPTGPLVPVKRRKGGFSTRKDAINYCSELMKQGKQRRRITLEQLYDEWSASYESRVGSSAMVNYLCAFKHFHTLHGLFLDEISAADLQKCMDDCTRGHRTHQNMKCIAGLLWGYAADQDLVDRDITKNLFIGRGYSVQRDPITQQQVEAIRNAIGRVRYAEYIYCLCYLGFRPGEMLELKKDMLFCTPITDSDGNEIPVWYFVNGKKTDAGKDRIVIVPDRILDIVVSRLFVPGTDLMFPMYVFSRAEGNPFRQFKPMSHEYFNKHVFKPLLSQLGFSGNLVPYCARHTYADLLKSASGSDRDKAALIGHSQYLFTQARYQSSAISDLKALVESFS